jgi:lysophospholipase L1-like esterase
VCLAIKPSPSRWKFAEEQRAANERIRKFCEDDKRLTFVDVWTPMLGDDSQPRRELFVDDMLHLNAAGYELWTTLVRPVLEK